MTRGGLIENPTGDELVELSGPSGQVKLQSIADLAVPGAISGSVSLAVSSGGPYRVTSDPIDFNGFVFLYGEVSLLTFDRDGDATLAADVYDTASSPFEDFSPPVPSMFDWILDAPFVGDPGELPIVTHKFMALVPRYFTFTVNIVQSGSLDLYAGSDSPSASWRLDWQSFH